MNKNFFVYKDEEEMMDIIAVEKMSIKFLANKRVLFRRKRR